MRKSKQVGRTVRAFTFSLCMIVKNEEKLLSRCLDSFAPLFDEIVIVDTGSDDRTKEIAARYTEHIFDFAWIDDFAAARNYAFSQCTCDYIYSCDADEVLDERNQLRFRQLMDAMLAEVEIVQMKYVERDSTVLNTKSEWRPKLFKRLRAFTWTDPVHEAVRLEPFVFDSDVEILHLPDKGHHSERDFSLFQKAWHEGKPLSGRLYSLYAAELFKRGSSSDFMDAIPIFVERTHVEDDAAKTTSFLVLAHAYRLAGDIPQFLQYALKPYTTGTELCSELCYELGCYFEEAKLYEEAALWFHSAYARTTPIIDIHTGGDLPLQKLANCYQALRQPDEAEKFQQLADAWTLPEGD